MTSSPATKLSIRNVTHCFDSGRDAGLVAIENVTVEVPDGTFVSIIGPSGCGKSTIFNIIAGLLRPSRGDVLIGDQVVTGMAGFVGYMLQKDLLLPWRTVLDNVILGMELRGVSKTAARAEAAESLRRFGLAGFERHYPSALSGGMRQRAALLRTLLYDSDLVLLDEPFGALDAQTRSEMQQWLLEIWTHFKKTVIFVTHDIDEAVLLSDEIVVMSPRPGRVRATLTNKLPRPRTLDDTLSSEFLAMKRECLELLSLDRRREAVPAHA